MTHNSPLEGEPLSRLGNEVLLDMFVDAWRTDNDEVDGERTYSVHHLRTSLERMGMARGPLGTLCTEAAHIARTETVEGDAS